MTNGVVSTPESGNSQSPGPNWTPYNLHEVRKKLEATFGSKVGMDDPSFMMMTGIDMLFRQTLDYFIQSIEERTRVAATEYRQGLDSAANEKKREVRQELINLATIIHEKLKIEADAINKPLLARIEDLKLIASTIGANYAQFRWHDRIVGFLCGALLFLAAFASGMVFEIVRK